MKTQNSIKSRETFVEASSIAAIAISVIALLITLTSSAAEFKFASVCSDDMVIQRDVASPVWGFAEPGAKVAVSLNGKAVGEATADEKGRWTVKLPAQKANKKPSTITAKCGKETHSITNVLFGDGHIELLRESVIPDKSKWKKCADKAFYNPLSTTGEWY